MNTITNFAILKPTLNNSIRNLDGPSPIDEVFAVAYRSLIDMIWVKTRVIPREVERQVETFVNNDYDEDMEVDDCLEDVTTDVITYNEKWYPTITCGRGSMFRRQLDQDGWEFVQVRGGNTNFRQKVVTKIPKLHPKEDRRVHNGVRRIRRNMRAPYAWSVVQQLRVQFYNMSMQDTVENRVVLHKAACRIMRDHGIRETAFAQLAERIVERYYIPQSRDASIREERESRATEVAVAEQSARLVDYGWQRWFGLGVRTPKLIPRDH
jgi:predicted RNA binding protein YcfA (HicA-like mRNA interferase family)